MTFMERYLNWYNHPYLEPVLKTQLEEIKDNPQEIEEAFYKDLEFGTGGLRGILGPGSNRMNIYTVSKATQGLANYINKSVADGVNKKVVIAYDSRHNSREFAQRAGQVLAQNNIEALVFQSIAPTPLLSYAVCQLQATAGIVVTASHNPKNYNGYKVYWSHGGQITDDLANAIIAEVMDINDELNIPVLELDTAIGQRLFHWLDDTLLNAYLEKTQDLIMNKELLATEGSQLKIVYTPLHGTGYIPVSRLLKESGFTNLQVVAEQSIADPDFSTVTYPNPEEEAAFTMALELAKSIDADLIMGTDPDADRLGVVVKDNEGQYIILTGNQLGALLIDYILQMKHKEQALPENSIVIKTIVTSTMGVDIAANYGIKYLDVLTGFKYIGEKIAQFEQSKEFSFVFGYEESYGFLAGDYIRDKDAVQIALLAAEMALYYKSKGQSLNSRLQGLFEQYGYYQEDLVNINLSGIEGQKKISEIIQYFRNEVPKEIDNQPVIVARDYLSSLEINLISGQESTINLPKSNVLHYTLEDNSWFCVRPSGTEPKLKFYLGVKETSKELAQEKITRLKKAIMALVDRL